MYVETLPDEFKLLISRNGSAEPHVELSYLRGRKLREHDEIAAILAIGAQSAIIGEIVYERTRDIAFGGRDGPCRQLEYRVYNP